MRKAIHQRGIAAPPLCVALSHSPPSGWSTVRDTSELSVCSEDGHDPRGSALQKGDEKNRLTKVLLLDARWPQFACVAARSAARATTLRKTGRLSPPPRVSRPIAQRGLRCDQAEPDYLRRGRECLLAWRRQDSEQQPYPRVDVALRAGQSCRRRSSRRRRRLLYRPTPTVRTRRWNQKGHVRCLPRPTKGST